MVNEKKIKEYGQKLTEWSNSNHLTIEINNQLINEEGPSPGGRAPVIWQDKFTKILGELIKESKCSEKELDETFEDISPKTKKIDLTKKLKCLGKIRFIPTKFFED